VIFTVHSPHSEVDECADPVVDGRGHCKQICNETAGNPFRCLCNEDYTLDEDYATCLPDFSTAQPTTLQVKHIKTIQHKATAFLFGITECADQTTY